MRPVKMKLACAVILHNKASDTIALLSKLQPLYVARALHINPQKFPLLVGNEVRPPAWADIAKYFITFIQKERAGQKLVMSATMFLRAFSMLFFINRPYVVHESRSHGAFRQRVPARTSRMIALRSAFVSFFHRAARPSFWICAHFLSVSAHNV